MTVSVEVTVRYFAAARAAAGTETEVLTVPVGTTMRTLVGQLSDRSADLARVLARCSYLCDGFAVRDTGVALENAQTVDVLPPFAGG